MDEKRDSGVGPTVAPPIPDEHVDSRRPYHPPVLDHLGEWRALTLQQSIGIG